VDTSWCDRLASLGQTQDWVGSLSQNYWFQITDTKKMNTSNANDNYNHLVLGDELEHNSNERFAVVNDFDADDDSFADYTAETDDSQLVSEVTLHAFTFDEDDDTAGFSGRSCSSLPTVEEMKTLGVELKLSR
jgi:hypothetical protein